MGGKWLMVLRNGCEGKRRSQHHPDNGEAQFFHYHEAKIDCFERQGPN
jgi:hypothetical protein